MAMLEKHRHQHALHDFDGLIEMRVNPPPLYFSILFYALVLWAVVFCAYFLLSGWSSEKEFTQKMAAFQQQKSQQKPSPQAGVPAAVETLEEKEVQAKELFSEHCASCHGADGKGGIGPDLTRTKFQYGRTREMIVKSITGGRPGGMPAFGNQLSAADIANLTDFVLGLK